MQMQLTPSPCSKKIFMFPACYVINCKVKYGVLEDFEYDISFSDGSLNFGLSVYFKSLVFSRVLLLAI